MKTVLIALSFVVGMSALPANSADDGAHEDGHKAEGNMEAMHTGRGKVVALDDQAGTIKLAHGPIKSLKWPKMTMDFKAHDPAMLKDIKPGTEVVFELMKMGGGYHIMKISPATN